MEFEWDEAKRPRNVTKHGIDLLQIEPLFDGRPVLTLVRRRSGEIGFVITGELGGRFYTVIWTRRGKTVRLISARRSRDAERQAYRSLHG